jgi:hypothetical protein
MERTGKPSRSLWVCQVKVVNGSCSLRSGRSWKSIVRIAACTIRFHIITSLDTALMQQSSIAKFDGPNARDFQFLVHWMKNPKMGNVYLLGQDSDIWEKPDLEDLVTLNARQVADSASRILTDRLIHWYHHLLGWRFRVRIQSTFQDGDFDTLRRNLELLLMNPTPCITPIQSSCAS